MARVGGFEALAAAVVIQAVEDVTKDKPRYVTNSRKQENMQAAKDIVKATAKRYLLSEDCKFVCEVLNIDYRRIVNKMGLEG
jgi:hypothetical protein